MVSMTKNLVALITLVILAALLCTAGCTSQPTITATGDNTTPAGTDTSLFVYSGAGLKKPMTAIGEAFTGKYGIGVDYTFAGSGTLIAQMDLSRKGDAFIPGGTPDYRTAQEKGLVGEPGYVAYHVPVIVVQKGNPQNITSVDDFTRSGLKIALGAANTTAIGKAGDKLFEKHGILDAVEKNVVLRAPTINEVVVAMNMGTADAALITLDQVNSATMDTIDLPQEDGLVLIVPVGATTFTEQPDAARQFIEFVTSDEGKAIFAKHGFPAYPDPAYAGIEP
ncbi:MAG: Molybdenum ABC transporter, periplasmic molybdate-binding protein [Methanoculleus marisnigri]|jgi:molybdate transport system substrate-binding protein|uniref:Molybdenum ABC transporter, periplasmic molybdate-binding protein n=1 Tax=Methanoculleus marisnigri TaxID=2198 RepID=A0A101GRQ7_9EURY|nr:MAG: Molybdenum ABC transporter, periplasmic molybdate-binding protein [Methanoculleus marisnigri]KUL03088.1 MAG: Molybdenum ABC transporter, periplasmic molybdate-binding protein [Methanoculleus marisnigri]